MPKDYKAMLVKELEQTLVLQYGQQETIDITNIIIKTLENYEITNKYINQVPFEDFNKNLLRQYAACLFVDGKSDGTIRQYIFTCKKIAEAINKRYTDMGIYDIRLFLIKEMERGVSARTRENTRANLSAFFQWMTREQIIPKNPMASLKPIKYADEIREAFSSVEIDALRSACNTKKERAIIEMLLSTGVRVSELVGMKVTDIDKDNLRVHVINGKGQKERITYTTPVAIKHLISYLEDRKEKNSEMLFYNKDHQPLNAGGVRYIIRKIAKRANIEDAHPHRFRRTFATNLSKRGMEIQEIQRLMGHANINTTMVYIQANDSQVQMSYKKFMT